MTNAERFLKAYAVIEKELNEIAGTTTYVNFSQLLSKCSQVNRVVKYYQEILKEYHELRNAIVHQRDDMLQIIAEPTDACTASIERIAETMLTGKEAIHFATQPVYTIRVVDRVREAFEIMKAHHVSKIPVYDYDNYAGLLTMEDITEWLLRGQSPETRVRTVMKPENRKRVLYFRATENIARIADVFDEHCRREEVPPIVLLTPSGKNDEKPVGIIAISDLAKVLAAIL